MITLHRWGSAALVLLFVATSLPAAPGELDDIAVLARQIDRRIGEGIKERNAVAAPLTSDSAFVRRVYLDLAGRIPRVSEVRVFLEDKRSDKRRRLVDQLLSGPNYTRNMTHVWRALLLPESNNQQVQFLAGSIENWLRPRLRSNAPYDRIVRDLLTTQLAGAPQRGVAVPGDNSAAAFYQANEMKPDNLAAATSRLFLGVKLECAQCHDHPFAKWTRKQFWEYTAFFAGIQPSSINGGRFVPVTDNGKIREITIPGSDKVVKARFLDGTDPKWGESTSARTTLADWMTAKDNPFFAKALANRLWEHFFGIGLVDPVDDFREENPASHPALLDDLARGFVEHSFDLKFLIRAITASQTYQRSSELSDKSQDDLRSFARMPLRGLTPEQVFDSLSVAVGYRGDATANQFGISFAAATTPRGEILSKFANPVDRRTEFQTTILQALALMNGRFIADATSIERSETLAALLDYPSMNLRDKLDTLYLATLSRPMRGSEAGRLLPYVESGGPSRNSRKALADVFWVLLNSSEFVLNH